MTSGKTIRLPSGLTVLIAMTMALAAGTALTSSPLDRYGLEFQDVDPDPAFPDAAADGTLRWACSDTADQLQAAFARRQVPYEAALVRTRDGRTCHIDYTPTVPGFRADPDDDPVEELFINVDALSLLSHREARFGDALDISKAVIPRLPRRLRVTLSAEREIDTRWYQEAAQFHFGAAAGQVAWRKSHVSMLANPWTQDFLKSGRTGQGNRILVARHLYQGRKEGGPVFDPMLHSLQNKRFVRSHLSWEGGDLQFTKDPRDPSRLVLFFGESAKAYWGKDLDQAEYAYVLKREFGADLAVDLSQLVPHVDYFVAFLPAARTALVSQPMIGNREMAEAAAVSLAERFRGVPPPSLQLLVTALGRIDAFSTGRTQVQRLLDLAKQEAAQGWPRTMDPALGAAIAEHVTRNCPARPQNCFGNRAIEKLLASDAPFLRHWVTVAVTDRTESVMDARLLSIVESQLRTELPPTQPRIEAAIHQLETLGFRVIRVPRLGGQSGLGAPWSGISYVNALLVDKTLFVPEFGLGVAERTILGDLDAALPGDYELVPVYARHLMLYNGGVHCTVAIVRQ